MWTFPERYELIDVLCNTRGILNERTPRTLRALFGSNTCATARLPSLVSSRTALEPVTNRTNSVFDFSAIPRKMNEYGLTGECVGVWRDERQPEVGPQGPSRRFHPSIAWPPCLPWGWRLEAEVLLRWSSWWGKEQIVLRGAGTPWIRPQLQACCAHSLYVRCKILHAE